MKIFKYITFIIIIFSFLWAQDEEPLAERIKKISENLLEGYAQPLITAFGSGISTGLFHSARSHDFLGFDLGVRVMYIQIPNSAKYFRGKALVCTPSGNTFLCDSVELDSISTIFGPKVRTDVPVSGNEVGIPPYIPAGFDLPGVPLVMPQLNVGLFLGAEIAIRYIPFQLKKFHGSEMSFLGIGVKQELNRFPIFKTVPLPLTLAIGGAYQTFGIKDSLGRQIINSQNWALQVLISKNIVALELFVGAGLEGTKVYFDYEFEYEIPDTVDGVPTDRIPIPANIQVELHSQNHYRAFVGFTFKIGFFYIHYDFNILPYTTHNGIVGLTFR